MLMMLTGGCAVSETRAPGEKGTSITREGQPSATKAAPRLAIPGFEDLGSPDLRRKKDVIAKHGQPLSEEAVPTHPQYSFLAYPVSGWEEKLLILFHGEDLLGFGREQFRNSLESTIRNHARQQDGRVTLFQSWFRGKTSYFLATRNQLSDAPKWTPASGTPPPISRQQAETIASDWLRKIDPALMAQPRVQDLLEVKSVPGAAFYVVALGLFDPPPNLSSVVVLMDGTVVEGKLE